MTEYQITNNPDGSESTDCPCPNCGELSLVRWLDEPSSDDYNIWSCYFCGWNAVNLPVKDSTDDGSSTQSSAE